MMKILFLLLLVSTSISTYASHITGGELMYTYIGPGSNPGTDRYRITLRLFRDCFSTGPLLQGEQVRVGIYNTQSNALIHTLQLPLSSDVSTLALNTNNFPCLVGSPKVCYQIAYYSNVIDLERNAGGYTLVQTACCRIGGITNIANSNNAGATYTTRIPGTVLIGQQINNSPQFQLRDTALVCSSKSFRLPFTATDVDGDSLSYAFVDAYGNVTANNQPLPPTLVLSSVAYQGQYNGQNPLGPEVSINPSNGLITGRAPATGRYVVAVSVIEWRNGRVINEHRKDFILSVQHCDFVSAELPDYRVICDDFTVSFENGSYSSLVTSYSWTFGDPTTTSDVSNNPVPSYTYSDTGIYRVKLVVQGGNGCADSAEADVAVYPGFDVKFGAIPHCSNNLSRFYDSTSAAYGSVNSWKWNFGDPAVLTDTSSVRDPSYRYTAVGSYPVTLVATSTKGCVDSSTRNIVINDKPYLHLPFKDTVVCGFDTLQLFAQGTGEFSWAPNNFISNANSANPHVYPPSSAIYIVTLNDNNCIGRDTVRITKLNSITMTTGRDTLICTTDTLDLRAVSAANYYTWAPASSVRSSTSANTSSLPLNNNTMFTVTGTLGRCTASASLQVQVAPYPVANAGADVSICPDSKVQLQGAVQGDGFSWTPNYALLHGTTLNPMVAPSQTTPYVLTARYNSGCPKPVSDTVIVSVHPNPVAFAGHDTAIVEGQPLQLFASGGITYQWSPATYLSDPFVSSPLVKMPSELDTLKYMLKVTDENGCSDYDDITISKFRTGATIIVPTGFTPNGDGKNDVLRPVLAGIKQLDFFRIYNRWGQLLFETREHGKGWNGTINGKEQNPGTYVFVIQAQDYLGRPVQQKGTIVLIR
ncbi:PKD domain-containing protein [Aridibaculum aurantiacum]|uniref:PKD domain-containing protein n=1 Tax=Aridibaculum aurantiacum TaxID=2810307 RepID=UPI001A96FCD0|nr:PKD domain-containing protein [Aridibaculum aurantiacum]